MKTIQKDYVTVLRQFELDSDITIVASKLRAAKTFEATLALRNLLTKLQHERRILK